MSGTVRASLALLAVGLFACGGAPSADPRSPEPAPTARAATQDVSASPPAPAAEAAGAAPAPAAGAQRWPFGPAPTPEDKAAQLERLKADPGPIKSNWVPPGRSDRYGHAEGLVDAPYDAVRARLVDFMHYRDLAGPKFRNVKVIAKEDAGTDVYFQLPIMKGLVTLWYVTRFPGARPHAGGGEVIEGTFVKGNIKGMHLAFTARPADSPDRTVLVCDLLLTLQLPAPQSAVDEELRDACGDAIKAVRAKVAPPPP